MEETRVKIVRSFGFKLALPGYENRDFSCALEIVVSLADVEEHSKRLHHLCVSQVQRDVADYKRSMAEAKARQQQA